MAKTQDTEAVRIRQQKKRLLEAMENTLCNVTNACRAAKLGRDTYYRYYKQDEVFRKAIDDLENVTFDYVESKILKQIKDENTAMIIFYAKTRMKGRGYVERTEHTGAGGEGLKVTWAIPTNGKE